MNITTIIPKSSVSLACDICETNAMIISHNTFRDIGKEAEKLEELGGLSHLMEDNRITVTNKNGDDIPLVRREDKYGYFDSDIDSWINVCDKLPAKYKLNIDWLLGLIKRDLKIDEHPKEIVSEHCWFLGAALMSKTEGRAHIFFARRLNDLKIREKVANFLWDKGGFSVPYIILSASASDNFSKKCTFPYNYHFILRKNWLAEENNNYRINYNILKNPKALSIHPNKLMDDEIYSLVVG